MRGGRRHLALLVAVSTLLFPPRCANGGSGETRAQFNGSAAACDSFVHAAEGEEFKRRRLIFQDAAKRHAYLNSFSTAPQSAKYGVNRFSDLSQREFRDLYLRASPDRAPPFTGLKTEGLPDRFDWRDKAVVAPVQNQEAEHKCHLHEGVLRKSNFRNRGNISVDLPDFTARYIN